MKLKYYWFFRLPPFLSRWISERPFGLKAKITLLILSVVTGILLFASYLDFQLSKKAQIDLYLDRNLYIATQIDTSVPDQRIMESLPQIKNEVEEWLMSRPSLMEIDLFLFTPKDWNLLTSHSKYTSPTRFALTHDQIKELKRDKYLSAIKEIEGEKQLEVITPLHSKKRVVGGIRILSSLDEAHSYLNRKKNWTLILTLSNIFIIFLMITLFFKKLVGNPIHKLVEAMNRAEKGDLEAEAHIQSQDELGELAKHFNRMIRTIRESHEQNIELLSKVNRFNEELTQKVETATSELRLLHEALSETQRQLSQSEKLAALGQVTATMAHQIGTPLNSISGYIQLMLQEGNLQPVDQNRLKIIESQLDRLADSFRKLLSYTSQPKPQLKPLDVNEVLKELIPLSEPWLRTRNITLYSSLDFNLPMILGDPTHLQTLFLNLLTNALDAMPNGGTLTIKTQLFSSPSSSENDQWVEIAIADTGVGISEEVKKRIFDPFFTTKKVGEGMGLGLSICEKIAKDHSGRLEVKSELGKGSTFFVYIPITKRRDDHE
ncbi:MAG: HAMP domain-containing sensor histidine kinase [Thermodesulfobacteriota bacterium]